MGLAFLPLAAALAQAAPPSVQTPLAVEGRIAAGAPLNEEQRRYVDHEVRLTAGTRYRIAAESPVDRGGFDTSLQVRQVGRAEPLAEAFNIDPFERENGGTNSRLDFTPPQTGNYQIRILTARDDEQGPYSARVEALPPLPAPSTAAPAATESGTWRVWNGAIEASDSTDFIYRYDEYPLVMRGDALWIAVVELRAVALDHEVRDFLFKIEVLSPDNPNGTPLASVEVALDATPVLAFRPPRTGLYLLRVVTNRDVPRAPYRLSLAEREDRHVPAASTP